MNWNGVRLGAFETYMDTPYWEQLQYVGDTRVQALLSVYLSGDDRLMRSAIAQFEQSRIPDGITTSRYPSALPQLIPPFSLIYVAMGWLIILAIGPLVRSVPTATIAWLIAGGVFYTLGTFFYHNPRVPYSHAVWHGFVLAGSVSHFVAVSTQVIPAA